MRNIYSIRRSRDEVVGLNMDRTIRPRVLPRGGCQL
jgi:hypothetical protein